MRRQAPPNVDRAVDVVLNRAVLARRNDVNLNLLRSPHMVYLLEVKYRRFQTFLSGLQLQRKVL
jgi:hypothetical protein